jgi:hypothetical protein
LKDAVGYNRGFPSLKVDGKRVNLPYIKLGVLSVMQDGYRVILRTNEGRIPIGFIQFFLISDGLKSVLIRSTSSMPTSAIIFYRIVLLASTKF